MPKLSISIPVYNGERTIKNTLDSILNQKLGSNVEIVISDNASTDSTKDIIHDYQTKYQNIKYFRNDKNVGADKNFDLAVRKASREYVWLMSADDIILPGAIERVLQVLKENTDVGYVYVNWFDGCNNNKPANPITRDRIYDSPDAYLRDRRISSIFISANIVKRSLWSSIDNSKYIGSCFPQLGAVLEIILIGKRSYYISTPCVLRPCLWDTDYKNTADWRISLTVSVMSIINQFRNRYSESSLSKCRKEVVSGLLQEVIHIKKSGRGFHLNEIVRLTKLCKTVPKYWVLVLPALLLPKKLYML